MRININNIEKKVYILANYNKNVIEIDRIEGEYIIYWDVGECSYIKMLKFKFNYMLRNNYFLLMNKINYMNAQSFINSSK